MKLFKRKRIKYDKIGSVPKSEAPVPKHISFNNKELEEDTVKKSKLKQWIQKIMQMNKVKYT